MQVCTLRTISKLGQPYKCLISLGLILIISLSLIMSLNLDNACAAEFQSRSSIDLGRQLNISALYQEVNATYKVEAHDDKQIKWPLSESARADKALVNSSGWIEVGSRARFDPSSKDMMDKELGFILDVVNGTLLNTTGSSISAEERKRAIGSIVYYSGDNIVDARTWSQCGDILAGKGNYAGSIYYYRRAIKLDPASVNSQNNMGAALSNLGKYQDAVKAYEIAANLTTSNSTVWSNEGMALYRMGNKDRALECFNRSCQIDQGNSLAWYGRGVILSERGRYGDALESFNRSIQTDPYRPEAWNNKGVVQAKLGRYDDAMLCFQSASTLNQKYVEAMVNGGIVLQKQGQTAKAEEIFALASKLGRNKTDDYYAAKMLPPVLMTEGSGRLPGMGVALAVFGVMGMRWLMVKRHR